MADQRRADLLSRLVARAGTRPSIADLCVVSAEVVGVTGAGITLMTADRAPQLQAGASDRVSSRLEELQFTLGEGPCLDAHHQGRPVAEPDLAHPSQVRWPAMASAALDAGAAAIFGYPLVAGTASIGALDLYRDQPGPLHPAQHADALTMANIAALAILAMQTTPDELATGLDDGNLRYLVHQAAGMLSVQLDVTVLEALDRIRAHAYAHQRPVEDVADDIVHQTLRLE